VTQYFLRVTQFSTYDGMTQKNSSRRAVISRAYKLRHYYNKEIPFCQELRG